MAGNTHHSELHFKIKGRIKSAGLNKQVTDSRKHWLRLCDYWLSADLWLLIISWSEKKSYRFRAPRTSHNVWTGSTAAAGQRCCCSSCCRPSWAEHSGRRWAGSQSSWRRHAAGPRWALRGRRQSEDGWHLHGNAWQTSGLTCEEEAPVCTQQVLLHQDQLLLCPVALQTLLHPRG